MAAGKTHSRHFRLLLDEYDLSGDMRQIGSAGIEYGEEDVTGWSDAVINYTLGRPTVKIDGFQAVFNNTLLTGVHVLKDVEEYLATLCVGIKAAPAVGDPCISMPLNQGAYKLSGDGPVLVSINLNGPGQDHTLPSNVFGAILAYAAALAATTNGASVNNGASSANGALCYLHITVSSGGTWAFKVQHSPNDSAWADLATFTINGSVVAVEQKAAAGTVDQYTRLVATRTSGTVTVTATIVRL